MHPCFDRNRGALEWGQRAARGKLVKAVAGTRIGAYLLVNCATLLWAGNIVIGRGMRDWIGPWGLTGFRAGIAGLLFAVLLRTERSSRKADRREWCLVLFMAAAGVVGFQALQYAGLRHTTAIHAGLVNATGPLLTLVLSRALLGHALRKTQIVGALLSLVGVGLILTRGSWLALTSLKVNRGDLLVLGAVTLWALYSIAGKAALKDRSTRWVAGSSTLLALPLLAVPSAVEITATPPVLDFRLLAALLYIGVGPSFLAFLAWNEGVRRLGPNGAMGFYNTLPLYAGLIGGLALGEWPGLPEWVGGTLVVVGCLVAVGTPVPGLAGVQGTQAR